MKNQGLLTLFLAVGISVGMPQLVRADFHSAATSVTPQDGQGDLAGDVTTMFAIDSENDRNLADVYSFCTEGSQQGNWQEDPIRVRETPSDNVMNEPVTFASFTPVNFPYNPPYNPPYTPPTTPDGPDPDPDPDPPPTVPEPATMLMLGLGAVGLLAYRRRK